MTSEGAAGIIHMVMMNAAISMIPYSMRGGGGGGWGVMLTEGRLLPDGLSFDNMT